MLFKDIKPGYPIYFLDKESVRSYQGKVVSVAMPRYDAPRFNASLPMPTGMVVDVTIDSEGQTRTYTIPESSSVTYAGQLVLSTDKDGLLREVEALKAASGEALAKVDRHRTVVENCNTLIEELNPAFAEKREQDRRIEGIETEVRNISQQLREFLSHQTGFSSPNT